MLTSPLVGSLQVAGRQPLIASCPSLAFWRPVQTWILAIMAASRYSLALRRCNTHWPKQVQVELMGVEIPIQLLDKAEALELVEFDPGVDSKDAWDPPKPMTSFLDKHFNRSLLDAEREVIMKESRNRTAM